MSDKDRLILEWLPGRYAVCRLEAHSPVPAWGLEGLQRAGPSSAPSTRVDSSERLDGGEDAPAHFVSVTRTDAELSIVCDETLVPGDVKSERGFAAARIVGQVDMSTVGIFARLTGALADAKIPVFVLSTFDTDYLMVRAQHMQQAAEALVAAGCNFVRNDS